ncbi:MAG: hypothetical protein DRP63_01280 [Planctomycetota bacterium]|nr:MAG: hypothetical protein DRP63_01280 [Planctomycetota bacterium]
MQRLGSAVAVLLWCGVVCAQKEPEFNWDDSRNLDSILRERNVAWVLDAWVSDNGRFMLVLSLAEIGGVEVSLIDLKRRKLTRIGRTLIAADAMSVKAGLFEWFSFWSYVWRPSNGAYMGHIEAVDKNRNGSWDEGEMFRLKVLRMGSQKGRVVALSWTMPYFCYANSGKKLFYTMTRKNGGRAEVVMASAGGGGGKRIYRAQKGRRIVFLEPSPNDKYLAIVEYVVGTAEPALVVLSVKERQVVLTQNISGLALKLPNCVLTWLPDSSGILLLREGKIWRLDIRSGELHEDLVITNAALQSINAIRIGVSFAPTQGNVAMVSVSARGQKGCAILYAPSSGILKRVNLMPEYVVSQLGRKSAVLKRIRRLDFKVMLVPVKWRKVLSAAKPSKQKKSKSVEKPAEQQEVSAPAVCELQEVVWKVPANNLMRMLEVRLIVGMRISLSGKHLLVLFATKDGTKMVAFVQLDENGAHLVSKWSPCGVPYPAMEYGIIASRLLLFSWGEECFRKDGAVPYVEFKDVNGNAIWDKGEVFVLGWVNGSGTKKQLLESTYFPWFAVDRKTGAIYCFTRSTQNKSVQLVRLLAGKRSTVQRFDENELPIAPKLSPDTRLISFSVVDKRTKSITFRVLDLKSGDLIFEKQCGMVKADGSTARLPLWTPDSRHVESEEGRCVAVEDIFSKQKQAFDYIKTIAEGIGAQKFYVVETRPAVFPQAMQILVRPVGSKYIFAYAYDPVSRFLFRIPTHPAETVVSFNPRYAVILKEPPGASIIVRRVKWRKPTQAELKDNTIPQP